jgi:hypothetical protein
MTQLKHWEDKMKQKRAKTSFHNFLAEIASWIPIVFYKVDGSVSRYPDTQRIPERIDAKKLEDIRGNFPETHAKEYDFSKNFFENYHELFKSVPILTLMSDPKSENSEYAEAVW